MATYRGKEIDLTPTDGMKAEGERFLEWRKAGERGGTDVAVARAVQLKNKQELSADTVRRMFSFFSRHEVDKQAEGFSPGEKGYPSPGRVAWAAWGGDAGFSWSRTKTAQLDKIDKEFSMADLQGAEIFSIGTWNGMKFEDADLDAIVRSFEELQLNGRVPLKLGHNDEQPVTDGQPALGWVDRVWKDGEKLMADFVNVPKEIYNAIRDKLYNFVSVELLQDAEQNGDSFPWVLSGVALLGADRPAVSNLKELSKLAMSCRKAMQFSKRGTINLSIGAKSMTDEKSLLDEIAALKAQVAKFSNENEAIIAERDKIIEATKAEKAESIKEQTIQKFESAIAAKIVLPSARERFFKWVFPKTVDAILEFSASEVDAYIEENKVNMSDEKRVATATKDDESKPADVRVSLRTRQFMAENKGMSYKDAMVEVLREDPALADEYRFMPDNRK